MKVKFNIGYIDGLKPRDKRYEVGDTLFPHLTIRVSPSGVKSYYILYRDSSGVLRRTKIGDARIITPTQARETAQKVLAEITTTGSDPRDKGAQEEPTLQNLVDMYKGAGRSEGTAGLVLKDYEDLLQSPAADIKQFEIELRREERRKNTKNTCATVNKSVASLKAVLNWATRRGVIQHNPLQNLQLLKEIDSVKKTRYLTDTERERLLKAVENRMDHFRPMIIVALNTGIRKRTLFALKWEDVNFTDRTIALRASTVKSMKHSVVPVNKAVIDALLVWREVLRQRGRKSELVFPSPQGGGVLDDVYNGWAAILKKAKIKNFRWHDMRHDFASQLVTKGVDLNTVRELLTHSDLKMTLRYAHLAESAKSDAVALLDKKEAEGEQSKAEEN